MELWILGIIFLVAVEVSYFLLLKYNPRKHWMEAKLDSIQLVLIGLTCLISLGLIVRSIRYLIQNWQMIWNGILAQGKLIGQALLIMLGIFLFFYINYLVSKFVRKKHKLTRKHK